MQGSAARPRRDVPVVSRKSLPWEIDRGSHVASDIPKPSSRPSSYGALAAPASHYESTISRVESMMNRVESTYSAAFVQDARSGGPNRQASSTVDSSRMQGYAPSALPPRATSGGYGETRTGLGGYSDAQRRVDAPQSYMSSTSQYAAPGPRIRNPTLEEPSNLGMPSRARVTSEDADSVFYSSLRGGQAEKPGFRFDAAPSKSSFDDDVPRRPRPFSGQNGVPVPNPVTKRSAPPAVPEPASSVSQYDRQYSKPPSQLQQPQPYSASASRVPQQQQTLAAQVPSSSAPDLLQPRRRTPVASAARKDADAGFSKFGSASASQQPPFSDPFMSSRQQPQPVNSRSSDAYGNSNLNHAASVAQRGSTQAAPMDERPSGNTELHPCPDCGRSFISSALERHSKICQSVFKGKKKPGDTDPYATGNAGAFSSQQQQVAAAPVKTSGRQPASVMQPQRDASDRWDAPKQSKAPDSTRSATRDAYPPSKDSFSSQKPQFNAYEHHQQPQPNYPSASSSAFSVPEYATSDANADADSGPLEECPDCGRKFNMKAFEKHVKICQKVRQFLSNYLSFSPSLFRFSCRSARRSMQQKHACRRRRSSWPSKPNGRPHRTRKKLRKNRNRLLLERRGRCPSGSWSICSFRRRSRQEKNTSKR